jgi:hypothetical protein
LLKRSNDEITVNRDNRSQSESNSAAIDFRTIEDAFTRVAARIGELSASLRPPECELLAQLLNATRDHPFIGYATDTKAVETADKHIAPHVKPSRRRVNEIAERVAAVAARALAGTSALRKSTDDVGPALGEALRRELSHLPLLERYHMRELLSNSLGGLSPTGVVPLEGWRYAAWLAAVYALTSDTVKMPTSTRPAFLNETLIQSLSKEAGIQSFLSVRMALRNVAPPGRTARQFGATEELRCYVSSCVGHDLIPGNGFSTDNATYLYYEDAGDGIQPHVDPFGITNALVMLERVPPPDGSAPSNLVAYNEKGRPIKVSLELGEMVVLSDGAVVHARERLLPGEKVTLLSLVFATPRSRIPMKAR